MSLTHILSEIYLSITDNGEDPLAGMDAEERKRHMIKTQLEACLSR